MGKLVPIDSKPSSQSRKRQHEHSTRARRLQLPAHEHHEAQFWREKTRQKSEASALIQSSSRSE